MHLTSNINLVLRWSARLGYKFISVTPFATLTVILGTLVSQISMLLAFFLPLKVIILLGSDGVPNYFPSSYIEIDKERLIIILSIAAICFYLAHQLSEHITKLSSDIGARKILARSLKLNLIENQDEAAISGYKRFSGSLAGAVFVLLSMLVLLWLYPWLLLLVVSYLLLVFSGLAMFHHHSEKTREILHLKLSSILNILASIGFLLSFSFIVLDYLIGESPGFIPAIISLLLLRQAYQRLSVLVIDLAKLYSQRVWLNALFFYNHVMMPNTLNLDKGVWPLLNIDQRRQWLPRLMESIGHNYPGELASSWHQSNQLDVAVLVVRDPDKPHDNGQLIEIFSEGRSVLALHEADLVGDPEIDEGLPALKLDAITELQSYRCHVYELPASAKILSSPHLTRQAAWKLRKRLLAIEPPAALVQRYVRSRPCLWQRLDQSMIERLFVAINDDAARTPLDELSAIFNDIQACLHSLPLVITNPVLQPGSLIELDTGEVAAIHWGNWALEPAGAAWPSTPDDFKRYADLLKSAQEKRSALRLTTVHHLLLSALMDSFEKSYRRQNYSECLILVPQLLDCFELVGDSWSSTRRIVG